MVKRQHTTGNTTKLFKALQPSVFVTKNAWGHLGLLLGGFTHLICIIPSPSGSYSWQHIPATIPSFDELHAEPIPRPVKSVPLEVGPRPQTFQLPGNSVIQQRPRITVLSEPFQFKSTSPTKLQSASGDCLEVPPARA